mmetsp:Transcript_62115/g.201402  ORF Transcript_62115/g.201402 Transcript_62115/m.201402 type:complete len:287 (+) Transcript_62115:1014-1874(+)
MMWCSGDWTDDTDQQIVLLQSMLHSVGKVEPTVFARRLNEWRRGGFAELGDQSGGGLGQATKAVMNDPRFVESPQLAAVAHSAATPSNGGVMRTAVVGLAEFWDDETVAEQAANQCRVTHADPRCVASCIAVAVAVARLLQGADQGEDSLEHCVIEPALARARAVLMDSPDATSEFDSHCRTQELGALVLDETRKIGYTFKCLGAGLWALRSAAGFRETLNTLIYEAGDADTNGTVAGALLGCRLGYSQLPRDWIEGMPYHSWLEAQVQKVLLAFEMPARHDAPLS